MSVHILRGKNATDCTCSYLEARDEALLPDLELVEDGLLDERLGLVPADGRVLKLLGDHEGRVVGLDEALLVQPRVHRRERLVKRVHVLLDVPPPLLHAGYVHHHRATQGLEKWYLKLDLVT